MSTSQESRRAETLHKTSRWYHWHDPACTRQERTLVMKLDLFVLSYVCLTFFVKYLDQTNITNAWVAGLSSDKQLNLQLNDLNWFTTWFNCGIIVGSVLFAPLMSMLPSNIMLPLFTTIWSLFVLFMYKAQNSQTFCGLRFAAGLFESLALPGGMYLIGSWYTSREINRRSTILVFAAVFGSMLSGFIQAGLTDNMEGRLGLPAWRWLFIFDFILTMPVAVFGVFCCPDEPKSKHKVWWMSSAEKDLAMQRKLAEEQEGSEYQASILKLLKSWQLYCFPIAYAVMNLTCGRLLMRFFIIFLDADSRDGGMGYTSAKANRLGPALGGLEFIWLICSGIVADRLGMGWPVILALCLLQLCAYIVLAVWTSSTAVNFAMYFVGSAYAGIAPLLLAWASTACGHKRLLRATTTGVMVALGYTTETLSQQYFFPTELAPRYTGTHGYAFGAAWVAVLAVYASVILPFIQKRMTLLESTTVEVLPADSITICIGEQQLLEKKSVTRIEEQAV